MDAQQFFAEFEHIANAPGGVARLRDLVLALATQGKLLPQNESEEPAEAQLSRIRGKALARRLTNRGKKTARNPGERSASTEGLLPKGWANVRICELVRVLNGRAYSKSELLDAGTPVLRVGNLFTSDQWYHSNLELEEDKYCDSGDLLYAWSASFGPFIWKGPRVIYHYHIWKLDIFSENDVNKKFLCTWLLEKTREIKAAGHGISMAHMTKEKFEQLLIALPPLDEQGRIVAKVDELMALCDTLETQREAGRKLQIASRQATLQALAASTSPRELQATWTHLNSNFGWLFRAAEDVRQLRDAIFDLALRGTFVRESQSYGSDERSSEELAPLPVGWRWKTLADLSEYITSGSRGWKTYLANAGDIFIRSQDIRHDALIFDNPAYVALPEKTEGKRTLVRQSDLLLTITGGNVGKCAIVPNFPSKAYVSQHVALIRLKDPNYCEFIHFWMINAFGGRGFLARYIYGDKPGLNLAQVGSVPVPMPTTTVLPQILDGLRVFKQMCDHLSRQLRDKQTLSAALATAAIASVAGVAIEDKEEETMKAPQIELIAPLRLGRTPHFKAQAPLASLLARQRNEMSARDLWQRFGGEIDAFYAQLKAEVADGWIEEPGVAEVRAKQTDTSVA